MSPIAQVHRGRLHCNNTNLSSNIELQLEPSQHLKKPDVVLLVVVAGLERGRAFDDGDVAGAEVGVHGPHELGADRLPAPLRLVLQLLRELVGEGLGVARRRVVVVLVVVVDVVARRAAVEGAGEREPRPLRARLSAVALVLSFLAPTRATGSTVASGAAGAAMSGASSSESTMLSQRE